MTGDRGRSAAPEDGFCGAGVIDEPGGGGGGGGLPLEGLGGGSGPDDLGGGGLPGEERGGTEGPAGGADDALVDVGRPGNDEGITGLEVLGAGDDAVGMGPGWDEGDPDGIPNPPEIGVQNPPSGQTID